MAAARRRLQELQTALGHRQWLVGDSFTIADLVMGSVLKIPRNLDLLEPLPTLKSYQDRCLDRAAYKKAVADQCETIKQHRKEDMKYPHMETDNG